MGSPLALPPMDTGSWVVRAVDRGGRKLLVRVTVKGRRMCHDRHVVTLLPADWRRAGVWLGGSLTITAIATFFAPLGRREAIHLRAPVRLDRGRGGGPVVRQRPVGAA